MTKDKFPCSFPSHPRSKDLLNILVIFSVESYVARFEHEISGEMSAEYFPNVQRKTC